MDCIYKSSGAVTLRGAGAQSAKYRGHGVCVFAIITSGRNMESGGINEVRTQIFLLGAGLTLKQYIIYA